MLFLKRGPKLKNNFIKNLRFLGISTAQAVEVPDKADVIVVGGGSAGCHALYHLAKRGIKAVLLERSKLTAGTTWHTAGLIWRLRPNDVDIEILQRSRNLLKSLEDETSLFPGWIQNGGLFIAHSKMRLDEYRRLSTIGNALNIENHLLDPSETKNVFPLINEKSLVGSLYSPGDGVVDPAMLCAALVKSATTNGAKVIENCPVDDFIICDEHNNKKILGVKTKCGNIKSNLIINATGAWGRDLVKKYGSILPLIPFKHAYIVTESIEGVRGLPNIRDHDYSIYFRIQGDSICMGGYEVNPIVLDEIPKDFNFSLYELDWSTFEEHNKRAINLCSTFKDIGIKRTVCGPESFTPDHKPLLGPDTKIKGLYHSVAYNSAGMMFGGGCGEQIALWAINGEPDLPMFQFDLRRFTSKQNSNLNWVKERSHESYVKNYGLVFKNDQPLAGRNLTLDPLHQDMKYHCAFFDEKQGWERPAFFLDEIVEVPAYAWEESHTRPNRYLEKLNSDLTYEFSDYHNLIGSEALACRKNAVVFNMSYFGKMILEGSEATEASEWIFNSRIKKKNKVTYTCALNGKGGVETDLTCLHIEKDAEQSIFSNFEHDAFYLVCGGASAYYTFNYLSSVIKSKNFKASIRDITHSLGIISIQGPKSRDIAQNVVTVNLSDESFPQNSAVSTTLSIGKVKVPIKILRVSFVGELGFEFHIPREYCSQVYNIIMKSGKKYNLKNAGFRALYSLSSEKGIHLWGLDLRSDDTPIEANLSFTCNNPLPYKGKDIIVKQRKEGIKKRLVLFTIDEQIPLWGLEGVYRNGENVGFIRRGEYAYSLGKSLGQAYIHREDGSNIDVNYIKSGNYEIEIMGIKYPAQCFLHSPLKQSN